MIKGLTIIEKSYCFNYLYLFRRNISDIAQLFRAGCTIVFPICALKVHLRKTYITNLFRRNILDIGQLFRAGYIIVFAICALKERLI